MSPTTEAILKSWSLDPLLLLGLLALALIYYRGWMILHGVLPSRFPCWRLVSFAGGLGALFLALASPLDAFAGLLLSAHMVQHLLLMSVAAPLLLLGAPTLPLLRGLPRSWARDGLGPFLVWPPLKSLGAFLVNPRVGWLALALGLIVWHIPAAFQLALASPGWHRWEHATFFLGAVLFWWPVISPYPSRPPWPEWALALYLLAADVVNTVLCAILTFSERVIYPIYENAPRLGGISALNDQVAAGVIMWVPGSLLFLVPAVALLIRWLSPQGMIAPSKRRNRGDDALTPPLRTRDTPAIEGASPQIVVDAINREPRALNRHPGQQPFQRPFDLLQLGALGRFLRSVGGRRFFQTISLVVAAAVVVDGWFGSPVSSQNLAGIVPWLDWRALTVLALLALGNVFCYACPFMLPRELGRRLGWSSHRWPRRLRSKWLAAALLLVFFWAYEAWALWDNPRATAGLIALFFLGAFVIDAWFKGASFCKYVCPIGQFQFVTSLLSPLEVRVRKPAACASCTTHDCLRGNEQRRGCELDLYLPRKSGNLDCTFCLDCVRACPHDNIGILATSPAAGLLSDAARAGLGRLFRRFDIAALALVVVFGGFAGAAAMTRPVASALSAVGRAWGNSPTELIIAAWFLTTTVALPIVLVGGSLVAARLVSRIPLSRREWFCRFTFTLVPIGTAMWASHALYHFVAGPSALGPWFFQKAADWGIRLGERSLWEFRWLSWPPDQLLACQIALLGGGVLGSLYLHWRLTAQLASRGGSKWRTFGPLTGVALALYAAGVWICLQPMSMRGIVGP